MKEDLTHRTKQFALETIRFSRTFPDSMESQIIRRQLIRAASSVGANYRAACRSRSKRDFISKIGVVVEEADEVGYWLELFEDLRGSQHPKLAALMKEAGEIAAIMVASINTARSRQD